MSAAMNYENIDESIDYEMELSHQFSTFYISSRMYGIEVKRVQEVARSLTLTPVPLAPSFVKGLINLRGQISPAVGLRDLFKLGETDLSQHMTVVCHIKGVLLSLLVDKIGEVMNFQDKDFEATPKTININMAKFMKGVYKTPNHLVSILDIDKIIEYIDSQS